MKKLAINKTLVKKKSMNSLHKLLEELRAGSRSEREKGTYFENLVKIYLRNEPKYQDLYSDVWLWEAWRAKWVEEGHQDPGVDTGIDLVAKTALGDYHAIQAKFWDSERTLYKKDVDSFFTASGKKPFTHRVIVFSTDKLSDNLKDALVDQTPPVATVNLSDLEASLVDWSQTLKKPESKPVLRKAKELRTYQKTAINNVVSGLADADRGKLIMACGTGKTFTSLRLAETMSGVNGKRGRILFLVPSLNLLSQTLTEWTQESALPLHCYAVCSDSEVGKKRNTKEDDFELLAHELQYPATTNAKQLAKAFKAREDDEHMSVIFSTYHSIETISESQKLYGLPEFDLIVCDEAHRTTGATYEGEEDSNFVKIHDADFINGKKRVYMTATPKVYGVQAKAKAENESIELYSMDRPEFYGETLHTITFSEAVHNLQVLCDYKVIVLTVSEDHISKSLQKLLADQDNSLRVDDAAKIVGCWRALSKMDSRDDLTFDPEPMRRAVAFAQVIELNQGARTHKVSSKHIADMFQRVVDAYRQDLIDENPENPEAISELVCEARHVDGGMGAAEKNVRLQWLKDETPPDTCRILSNVRCLSEGVDVPALDAVLFLTPRNSQVDVVQSVGRVMRKSPNKKLGYVILPVVIPANVTPEEALNDNKTYKVVWEVLQALRSHDDRFDAMINKLELTGQDRSKMEVIAITNSVAPKAKAKKDGKTSGKKTGNLGKSNGKKSSGTSEGEQLNLAMEFSEIERAILAKVVKKVGNRLYWDDWAKDIARIAQTHISRITAILGTASNTSEIKAFDKFLKELRADLNDGINRAEAIEMLAQHIITKPVFDALFEGYSFTSNNPVSKAMQGVLDVLNEHNLDKESETLTKFYESVRMRASGITEVKAKQKIIVDLYDKFFRNAFPKLVERLGIVYTPVEVVDFIIKSINEVLHHQFGQTLGDKNVHIIDPFTGTGTFIARLLQSGLITKEQLAYKYQHEIHANEIVLLAYYIAAINIEQIYHDLMGGDYVPFGGICLTDTFALYEKEDLATPVLTDNSSRRRKQKKLDIRVIFGNPPYSEGQASANDDGPTSSYPHSNSRIKATYAELSERPNVRNLYNSYVRAFRWASDRIGDSGVIGFVSASGFIEKSAMDGMRKSLMNEFASIHVLNLRGDIRKNMLSKGRAREGQNIFDSGSMTGISITILVKDPKAKGQAEVFYHDIGDDLTTRQKLDRISDLGSVFSIREHKPGWTKITPDEHGDWINQRDSGLAENILMGDKRGDSPKLFDLFSQGVTTARDSWCYSSSKTSLATNVSRMISTYNAEVKRFAKAFGSKGKKEREDALDGFIDKDATKISWTRALKKDVLKDKVQDFDEKSIVPALYRPFTKQWLYFNRRLNEYVYKMPVLFPDAKSENQVICISGVGARSGFSTLIADRVPDFHMLDTGQCFPLYVYGEDSDEEESAGNQGALFASGKAAPKKRYALNDEGLAHFQEAYPSHKVTKEDVFYYVYGLLHSPSYRMLYEDNLSKELPRIPRVKTFDDFQRFSKAGRTLADLHLNYETAKPYPLTLEGVKSLAGLTAADLHVPSKMKYGKGANGERHDKTKIIYNSRITLSGVPVEAYEYVVNGRPAIEWVMEKQAVSEHKDSQITNDPSSWAIETMGDPAYSLKLLQRVVTVSIETMKIVKDLPSLYEDEDSLVNGPAYEVSRSLKPLSIPEAKIFYEKLPKWVSSQKVTNPSTLSIAIKVGSDDKSIEEFAKAAPAAIVLNEGAYLKKINGTAAYSAIAVFPSGASRTIGEVRDGKIELFGYWAMFDPDEDMAEESLGEQLTLQLNFVVVEVKNGVH